MKKTHIGRGLLILLLVSICTFGFIPSGKADITKSATTQFIDPEDMVQGVYYFYWDHGSGAMVAQFDRYDNGTIYNTYSITPQQSLFSHNTSCTVYDAGNIQLASVAEILHLLRCILAGIYTP
ncbi:MAG: hypothetical protein ABI480_09425 [Chitinophagaceae bacterium]